jgi:S-adenosylmethionine:tRNA ribosyltransferase-isomerase
MAFVTLFVGAGTFLPPTEAQIESGRLWPETGLVTQDTADRINQARDKGGRVIAVGTTALRLLESAGDETGRVKPYQGATGLFIRPGYRCRTVDLLLTNFHLPRSSLFMLVAAFAGLQRMRTAYAHAIGAGYRFYSYGDASLLSPQPPDEVACSASR